MTKTELMSLVAKGVHKEAVTHSIYGTFVITDMRAAAQELAELIQVALYDINPFIRTHRVTEQARIDILTEASWREDPGLGFDTPDGFVMIDGHHRALRREQEGCTHMRLWRFPFEVVSAFKPMPGWFNGADINPDLDWGDKIVDGKIIRGSAK